MFHLFHRNWIGPAWAVIALFCLAVLGCGGGLEIPELVPVTGTVTLDGQPLEGASIRFVPVDIDAGKGASAVTDAGGQYELKYSPDHPGVIAGTHSVYISKPGDDETETLPAKFNADSTLQKEVEPGGGPIDFDLKSQ